MAKYIIYQAIARLWGEGRFSSWDDATLSYLKGLGVDYLYLVGIPRHAIGKDFVKGDPGCPYSVSDWFDTNDYFSVNPEYRMREFDMFVDRVHKAGLKLMIDYIPNHVARDYVGDIQHFDYCDGDWTDTLKNDWSSLETRRAMVQILKFWAGRGVDGFRCDMVELVPCDALGGVIREVRREYSGLLFVAEVYGKENYRRYIGAGFDLLYDKSGLYDSLVGIYNGASARSITYNWQSLGDIQDQMLCFLENHDEPRFASLFDKPSFAALAMSLLFNNSSFMLYFGGEVGEQALESDNGRTSIFNWTRPRGITALYDFIHGKLSLEPHQAAILARYRQLIALSKQAAFNGLNWDLVYCNTDRLDADRQFVFLRYGNEGIATGFQVYLCACNFSPKPCEMTIRIPSELREVVDCEEVTISVEAYDYAHSHLRSDCHGCASQ